MSRKRRDALRVEWVVRLWHALGIFGAVLGSLPALATALSPVWNDGSLGIDAIDLCSLHLSWHTLAVESVVRLGDAGRPLFTSRATGPTDSTTLRVDFGSGKRSAVTSHHSRGRRSRHWCLCCCWSLCYCWNLCRCRRLCGYWCFCCCWCLR